MRSRDLMGAVLAGGEGRRFGGGKALAPLAGRPLAAWPLRALDACLPGSVVVANEPGISEALGVRGRRDDVPGLGPAGGLLTALRWAREEGREGVFVLACDLPLMTPVVVGRILDAWPTGARAVAPESPGPVDVEPLCAGYGTACLAPLEELLDEGPAPMVEMVRRVRPSRVPAPALGSPEALREAFLNVNTRREMVRAEELLARRGNGKLPEAGS